MFEFFMQKIAPQNIWDKMFYSGAEGSAIDIIREIKRLSNMTEYPTYQKDILVKNLSAAFQQALNYEAYKGLSEAERRKLKQEIAKAIVEKFNELDSIKITKTYYPESYSVERPSTSVFSIFEPYREITGLNGNQYSEDRKGLTFYAKYIKKSEFDEYECVTKKVKFPEIFYASSTELLSDRVKQSIPYKFNYIIRKASLLLK